ncbi:MAG: hypothetical protein AAFR46_11460 [Pseudomonadota bacterium]
MPGQSENFSFLSETLGIVSLPHIAGMAPNTWIAILVIVLVFAIFLMGSPGRRRR